MFYEVWLLRLCLHTMNPYIDFTCWFHLMWRPAKYGFCACSLNTLVLTFDVTQAHASLLFYNFFRGCICSFPFCVRKSEHFWRYTDRISVVHLDRPSQVASNPVPSWLSLISLSTKRFHWLLFRRSAFIDCSFDQSFSQIAISTKRFHAALFLRSTCSPWCSNLTVNGSICVRPL